MRELPILFSTPMVQAILDNRKTMTRRTRGLEAVNTEPDEYKILNFFGSKGILFQTKNDYSHRF